MVRADFFPIVSEDFGSAAAAPGRKELLNEGRLRTGVRHLCRIGPVEVAIFSTTHEKAVRAMIPQTTACWCMEHVAGINLLS